MKKQKNNNNSWKRLNEKIIESLINEGKSWELNHYIPKNACNGQSMIAFTTAFPGEYYCGISRSSWLTLEWF